MTIRSRTALMAATAAVTAAAMAMPAQATRAGWYVGLQGGLNEAEDASTITSNNPGASANPQVFDAEYDTGNLFGTTLGYLFANGWRPEVSFTLRNNDFESTDIIGGGNTAANGEVENTSLLANLWYNTRAGETVQPYFGLGFGANKVSLENFSNNPGGNYSADDTVFAGQAGVGMQVALGARANLDLGYRYLMSEDPELSNSNTRYDTEYSAHSLLLAFNYVFSPAAPLDADGDGVANKFDKCPRTPSAASVGADGCPLDSDGDGVADYQDNCPNTAPGAQVNAKGCALDGDGDGVSDTADLCPNTPKGVTVNANGCPADGDKDGVPDGVDQCPNTLPGVPVEANGCAKDSDGDGVPDVADQCPNTAQGAAVMTNGCGEKQALVLEDVNFEFNSAKLTPNARTILNDTAALLNDNAGFRVEIGGHTDSVGPASYNQSLSQQRARSVADYLTSKGVASSRLEAVGYGEKQPIESNMLKEGRAQNRRVEMKVIR